MNYLSILFTSLCVSVLVASQAAASTKVGVIGALNPDVKVKAADGALRAVKVGDDVFLNDTVITEGKGSAQLMFLDRSALTVSPNTEVKIDTFVYNPNTEDGVMGISAAKGAIRLIGGALTKKKPVKIKTPISTLGVRGGIADAFIGSGGQTEGVFIFGTKFTMTNANGDTVSTTTFGTGFGQGSAGAKPISLPKSVIQNRIQSSPVQTSVDNATNIGDSNEIEQKIDLDTENKESTPQNQNDDDGQEPGVNDTRAKQDSDNDSGSNDPQKRSNDESGDPRSPEPKEGNNDPFANQNQDSGDKKGDRTGQNQQGPGGDNQNKFSRNNFNDGGEQNQGSNQNGRQGNGEQLLVIEVPALEPIETDTSGNTQGTSQEGLRDDVQQFVDGGGDTDNGRGPKFDVAGTDIEDKIAPPPPGGDGGNIFTDGPGDGDGDILDIVGTTEDDLDEEEEDTAGPPPGGGGGGGGGPPPLTGVDLYPLYDDITQNLHGNTFTDDARTEIRQLIIDTVIDPTLANAAADNAGNDYETVYGYTAGLFTQDIVGYTHYSRWMNYDNQQVFFDFDPDHKIRGVFHVKDANPGLNPVANPEAGYESHFVFGGNLSNQIFVSDGTEAPEFGAQLGHHDHQLHNLPNDYYANFDVEVTDEYIHGFSSDNVYYGDYVSTFTTIGAGDPTYPQFPAGSYKEIGNGVFVDYTNDIYYDASGTDLGYTAGHYYDEFGGYFYDFDNDGNYEDDTGDPYDADSYEYTYTTTDYREADRDMQEAEGVVVSSNHVSGVECSSCEFVSWGVWAVVSSSEEGQVQDVAYVPYVVGELTDVPTSGAIGPGGQHEYSGNIIANVLNDGTYDRLAVSGFDAGIDLDNRKVQYFVGDIDGYDLGFNATGTAVTGGSTGINAAASLVGNSYNHTAGDALANGGYIIGNGTVGFKDVPIVSLTGPASDIDGRINGALFGNDDPSTTGVDETAADLAGNIIMEHNADPVAASGIYLGTRMP